MGRYLTPDDVRDCFAKPIAELAKKFNKTCAEWEQAVHAKKVLREDLYLNVVGAEAGMAAIRKLYREVNGKLEDAIAGVYRYREAERHQTGSKKKKGRA